MWVFSVTVDGLQKQPGGSSFYCCCAQQCADELQIKVSEAYGHGNFLEQRVVGGWGREGLAMPYFCVVISKHGHSGCCRCHGGPPTSNKMAEVNS